IDIATPLRESAQALGLPAAARLRLIELPLAARSILAGIKTSAVINVGTATIAAFIGAGGYGERIVAGLAVNDSTMLLAGAVPAAVLALLLQWTFDALEQRVIPQGLQEKRGGAAV
ncbi:MAG: amino acid ABC transporter permease, partial [Stutzerimonas stutzeri]